MGDGAAAGRDGFDIEGGKAQRLAVDPALRHHAGLAAGDDREVGRRSAHVEGDEVGNPEFGRHGCAGDDTAGGPGEQHGRWVFPRGLGRRDAAGAAHQ